MIINHNLSAMFAQRQLSVNGGAISGEIETLSSGLRITAPEWSSPDFVDTRICLASPQCAA